MSSKPDHLYNMWSQRNRLANPYLNEFLSLQPATDNVNNRKKKICPISFSCGGQLFVLKRSLPFWQQCKAIHNLATAHDSMVALFITMAMPACIISSAWLARFQWIFVEEKKILCWVVRRWIFVYYLLKSFSFLLNTEQVIWISCLTSQLMKLVHNCLFLLATVHPPFALFRKCPLWVISYQNHVSFSWRYKDGVHNLCWELFKNASFWNVRMLCWSQLVSPQRCVSHSGALVTAVHQLKSLIEYIS